MDADVYGGYAACPRARRGRRAKGKPCITPHPAPRAPRDKRRTDSRNRAAGSARRIELSGPRKACLEHRLSEGQKLEEIRGIL